MESNEKHTRSTPRHPNTYMLGAYKRLHSWLCQISSKSNVNKSICILTMDQFGDKKDGEIVSSNQPYAHNMNDIIQDLVLQPETVQLVQKSSAGWAGVFEARFWTQANEHIVRVIIDSAKISDDLGIDACLDKMSMFLVISSVRKRPGHIFAYQILQGIYPDWKHDKEHFENWTFSEADWSKLLAWSIKSEVQDVKSVDWKHKAMNDMNTVITVNNPNQIGFRFNSEPWIIGAPPRPRDIWVTVKH